MGKVEIVLGIWGALLICFNLKRIKFLELSIFEAVFIAAVIIMGKLILPYIYLQNINLTRTIPLMLVLLFTLLIIVKKHKQYKGGEGIIVAFSVLLSMFMYSILENLKKRFITYFYVYSKKYSWNFMHKTVTLMVFIVVTSVLLVAVSYGLTLLVRYKIDIIREFSLKYREVDRSVIFVLVLTFAYLMMTELLTFSPSDSTFALPLLWIGMSVMILLIQIVYIRLLVKSIYLKEDVQLKEKDWKIVTLYNKELEKNMQGLKDVRHDIKNVFFTMGGFVEQSGNEEMKSFYNENIVPFVQQELLKGDLHVKLNHIRDESMKAFLFYKIMQGIEQNVKMNLEIYLEEEMGKSMSQTDITRILGILIDNAIEEAKKCKGMVSIQIKESKKELGFFIRNSVREETRLRGVVAGTTDKGLGRGNGLLIVDKIIHKYKNLILNSYFQQSEFVQYLRIEKHE